MANAREVGWEISESTGLACLFLLILFYNIYKASQSRAPTCNTLPSLFFLLRFSAGITVEAYQVVMCVFPVAGQDA